MSVTTNEFLLCVLCVYSENMALLHALHVNVQCALHLNNPCSVLKIEEGAMHFQIFLVYCT